MNGLGWERSLFLFSWGQAGKRKKREGGRMHSYCNTLTGRTNESVFSVPAHKRHQRPWIEPKGSLLLSQNSSVSGVTRPAGSVWVLFVF